MINEFDVITERPSLHARFDPFWRWIRLRHTALKLLLACLAGPLLSIPAFRLPWLFTMVVSSVLLAVAVTNPAVKETVWTESNPKGTFTEKTKQTALALAFAPLAGIFAHVAYPDDPRGLAIAALLPPCAVLAAVAMYLQASMSMGAGGPTRYKFD